MWRHSASSSSNIQPMYGQYPFQLTHLAHTFTTINIDSKTKRLHTCVYNLISNQICRPVVIGTFIAFPLSSVLNTHGQIEIHKFIHLVRLCYRYWNFKQLQIARIRRTTQTPFTANEKKDLLRNAPLHWCWKRQLLLFINYYCLFSLGPGIYRVPFGQPGKSLTSSLDTFLFASSV